jgi:Na+-transporting NADH:ubiquinone oxidoreductase subunit A
MRDAHTGRLPDPAGVPQAVIVSTLSLEPFTTRGDVQIKDNISAFARGLEILQSMLEYQPIFLVFPKVNSAFAREVRETLRGYAWLRLVEVSTVYPADDFAVIARSLGLRVSAEKGIVWGVRTQGVLAVDRAITAQESVTTRIIAVGGPGVPHPTHVEVPVGYPLAKLRELYAISPAQRLLSGGALTGTLIGANLLGVDAECDGLTAIPEPTEREFLSFLRPWFNRRSYARAGASSLIPRSVTERFTTALRGENRACISCGYCSEVCPVGIAPSAIHKLLYQDNIDEVESFQPLRCIGCGLCSYVCPSKIELASEIVRVRDRIRQEQPHGKAGQ